MLEINIKNLITGNPLDSRCMWNTEMFFTFSAIRSIEKVLHLPKKSTSRF